MIGRLKMNETFHDMTPPPSPKPPPGCRYMLVYHQGGTKYKKKMYIKYKILIRL